METVITVDRIEGSTAVLEVSGSLVDWPLAALPEGTREGDRFRVTMTPVAPDTSEAEARLARLRARGPAGDDIDL